MYYGRGMIIITYADDTLFFGPDYNVIEQAIADLEALGYILTRKKLDGSISFAFLGFSIFLDPVTKLLKMIQKVLILKVLTPTGISECNTCGSTALSNLMGNNA